ncbi:MAG TPA: bifunctional diguanylate cyclase/phosphodiesterase [Desulfobulbus sp.]|nr:bifunctional diguanylate cyclase/phosphodiesterase [Desulfobulbus sp.]
MLRTMNVLHRQKSLKFFIAASLLAVSLVTFILVYLCTSAIFQKSHLRQAKNTAQGVSTQAVDSLLQLMENGWSRQKLLHYFDPILNANPEIPMRITLLRAPIVEELFGSLEDAKPQPEMEQVLKSGRMIFKEKGYSVERIIAIRARQECLSCHKNARVGDIFGVLKIEQDLGPAIHAHLKNLMLLFLALSPFPILLAVLISSYTTGKIAKSVVVLRDNIRRINSVQDLTNLVFSSAETDFVELNQILMEVDILVSKVKDTAVDRHLLEFEVNLLESFLITSDVVRNWKDHVISLLGHFNEEMVAYSLFSIFKSGEDQYQLEIFWKQTPSKTTCEHFERIVQQRIREDEHLPFLAGIEIHHTIINKTTSEINFNEQDIDAQLKTIFLNQPKIGGIVGIGLQSGLSDDIGGSLVIEGVLTTLMNVIGSVRAIYNHNKEMEYHATRDPLTGLFNQRVFWDLAANEMHRARRHNHPFSLLVLDLDNFKMVNDRYGHIFGDTFLQMLAGKIELFLREGDILTRYGGDEFAVILPETDQEEAYSAAVRVLDSLKAITLEAPDGSRIKSTVSIGLAIYPDHAEELNALFMIADNMMYKAKKEGKNKIRVPTGQDTLKAFRAKDEQALFLLNVLENPDQVIPLFQPIVDIRSNSAPMHELLMGIRQEDHILRANSFIDVAEKMGIISQLDFIVIEKAFKEVLKKQYQGMLFINLSPNSLILKRYVTSVRNLAAEYRINPANIVFEITERDTVRNRSLLEKFARELKGEGFKFAIDDFGSGFSTFHYLKLFSIDYIKIEGDFVKNIPGNKKDRALVKNIVSLAKDLNIRTIAEYIETAEILQAVEDIGADYAQGYFTGKPGPELKNY